jgi:hypothetical protein
MESNLLASNVTTAMLTERMTAVMETVPSLLDSHATKTSMGAVHARFIVETGFSILHMENSAMMAIRQ